MVRPVRALRWVSVPADSIGPAVCAPATATWLADDPRLGRVKSSARAGRFPAVASVPEAEIALAVYLAEEIVPVATDQAAATDRLAEAIAPEGPAVVTVPVAAIDPAVEATGQDDLAMVIDRGDPVMATVPDGPGIDRDAPVIGPRDLVKAVAASSGGPATVRSLAAAEIAPAIDPDGRPIVPGAPATGRSSAAATTTTTSATS